MTFSNHALKSYAFELPNSTNSLAKPLLTHRCSNGSREKSATSIDPLYTVLLTLEDVSDGDSDSSAEYHDAISDELPPLSPSVQPYSTSSPRHANLSDSPITSPSHLGTLQSVGELHCDAPEPSISGVESYGMHR